MKAADLKPYRISNRGKTRRPFKEIVVVLNDQIVKLPTNAVNASATQVASGAGKYSTGGTNSAIESAQEPNNSMLSVEVEQLRTSG
ncbi:hypothetical protein [Paenibacillus arenosi]|uniref:Uncharacterized protein n=1 Tax=Paenibacillus arenosi TaxID=2774142 RepID=A0ABR9B3D7_9BACL|nr:hypothetical protein [Paenibacillus arenosi]MBD8499686.1 hypothetical protein [Paenibacillus arenosi]